MVVEKPWFFWQAGLTRCPPNTVHLKTIELPPDARSLYSRSRGTDGARGGGDTGETDCPTLVRRPLAFQYLISNMTGLASVGSAATKK